MVTREKESLQGSWEEKDMTRINFNSTNLLRDNSVEAVALLEELRAKLKRPLLHVQIISITKEGISITYKSLRHTRGNIKNLPLHSGDTKNVEEIIELEEGFEEMDESLMK